MKTLLTYLCLIPMLLACGKIGDAGSAGPAGPAGPEGSAGPQGPAGSLITKSVNCETKNAYSTFPFSYTYLQYSNGDVFVSCSIFNLAVTMSRTNYYRATDASAATGACILGFDIDAVSGGKWTFTNTPAKQIVYSDNGVNGATYNFTAPECITE